MPRNPNIASSRMVTGFNANYKILIYAGKLKFKLIKIL